jgi:hypothetical protein
MRRPTAALLSADQLNGRRPPAPGRRRAPRDAPPSVWVSGCTEPLSTSTKSTSGAPRVASIDSMQVRMKPRLVAKGDDDRRGHSGGRPAPDPVGTGTGRASPRSSHPSAAGVDHVPDVASPGAGGSGAPMRRWQRTSGRWITWCASSHARRARSCSRSGRLPPAGPALEGDPRSDGERPSHVGRREEELGRVGRLEPGIHMPAGRRHRVLVGVDHRAKGESARTASCATASGAQMSPGNRSATGAPPLAASPRRSMSAGAGRVVGAFDADALAGPVEPGDAEQGGEGRLPGVSWTTTVRVQCGVVCCCRAWSVWTVSGVGSPAMTMTRLRASASGLGTNWMGATPRGAAPTLRRGPGRGRHRGGGREGPGAQREPVPPGQSTGRAN